MKFALVVLATVSLTLAEPPVPSSQYLPANQYIPPSNQYGAPRPFSPPSTSYGTPAQTQAVIKPSSAYGPPSGTYKPPSSQYGPPSSQYGPPSSQYVPPSSQYGPPSGAYLPPGGGYGGGKDDLSQPANYQFAYHVQDAASGNDFGHEEQRQGDVAKGKYFVLLPDGRLQTVEYTADLDGYKPKISYEQIGGGYSSGGSGGYPSGGSGGYPSGGSGGYPSSGGAGGYPSGGAGGYQY